ncbi:MAG: excalibur calcium-binding domain-containing protein [Candidatus Colwellbacteria bacterium]
MNNMANISKKHLMVGGVTTLAFVGLLSLMGGGDYDAPDKAESNKALELIDDLSGQKTNTAGFVEPYDAQDPYVRTDNPSVERSYGDYGDRDCGDFSTHAEAQAFFEAEGGPTHDYHNLDRDGDGIACESLP